MTAVKLLGIDVGTSGAKVVLIDAEGTALGAASRDHPTYTPAPGFREQEAEDWWQGAVACLRQVIAESGVDPREIAGISLSGQGCACLPVSREGEPLGRALIWTDERAAGQQARIRAIFGAELGRVAGNEIYDQPEPRMMWLRDHEPEKYRWADKFLTTVSYLIFRLTGRLAANRSDWGFHLAFDRASGGWNEPFLHEIGLDSDKFPQLYMPTDIVGGLSAQAAEATGLLAGTPVIAGGQDSTVSALAVGALSAGQSVYMRGTTDLLSVCTEQAGYHPDLYTTCAVLPGLYIRYDMKEVVAAGAGFQWLAGILFGRAEAETFETMDSLAAAAPPGSNGLIFLPYLLMATNPDPARQRAGGFFGVATTTTRGDLCRAVMEGTAFALREAIERIAAADIATSELRATGGPTRSDLWNGITADVTGLPVRLPIISAGAAYGAALLAGLGAGVYPMDDDYRALASAVRLRDAVEPRPEIRSIYGRAYQAFRRLAVQSAGIVSKSGQPE